MAVPTTDKAIASHVLKGFKDECLSTSWVLALPNTIGKMIAVAGIEASWEFIPGMLADSYVDMFEAGCIDGSRKVAESQQDSLHLRLGTRRLYDFIHQNPLCFIAPASSINNPAVASQSPNLISIK